VNLKTDDSADIDAVNVFEQVPDYVTLVSLIVEHSELYEAKGHLVLPTQLRSQHFLEYVSLSAIMFFHPSEITGIL